MPLNSQAVLGKWGSIAAAEPVRPRTNDWGKQGE